MLHTSFDRFGIALAAMLPPAAMLTPRGMPAKLAQRARAPEKERARMKSSIATLASACALWIGLSSLPVLAQASANTGKEPRVPFGDTQIALHAPSQHCMLDPSHPADQSLAAREFHPRAGKLNTYLGAFVDCRAHAALRNAGSTQHTISSYAYYLAMTATATNPVAMPRGEVIQRVCDNARNRSGTLDLADQNANTELNARMSALPAGKPWFGPIVAQDGNGCYQIILYKSLASGLETREALVTIVTFVKRRQVTYTRAVPYSSDGLTSLVKMVQSEVAAFLELNP